MLSEFFYFYPRHTAKNCHTVALCRLVDSLEQFQTGKFQASGQGPLSNTLLAFSNMNQDVKLNWIFHATTLNSAAKCNDVRWNALLAIPIAS
jgi:hypothetical protein